MVVPRFCNRAAWIPPWLCGRCLAIRWRGSSIAGTISSRYSLALGGAGLQHRGHGRAELVVFAGYPEGRRTAEAEKVRAGRASFIGGRRAYQSRARAFRPQSHFRRDVLLHRL